MSYNQRIVFTTIQESAFNLLVPTVDRIINDVLEKGKFRSLANFEFIYVSVKLTTHGTYRITFYPANSRSVHYFTKATVNQSNHYDPYHPSMVRYRPQTNFGETAFYSNAGNFGPVSGSFQQIPMPGNSGIIANVANAASVKRCTEQLDWIVQSSLPNETITAIEALGDKMIISPECVHRLIVSDVSIDVDTHLTFEVESGVVMDVFAKSWCKMRDFDTLDNSDFTYTEVLPVRLPEHGQNIPTSEIKRELPPELKNSLEQLRPYVEEDRVIVQDFLGFRKLVYHIQAYLAGTSGNYSTSELTVATRNDDFTISYNSSKVSVTFYRRDGGGTIYRHGVPARQFTLTKGIEGDIAAECGINSVLAVDRSPESVNENWPLFKYSIASLLDSHRKGQLETLQSRDFSIGITSDNIIILDKTGVAVLIMDFTGYATIVSPPTDIGQKSRSVIVDVREGVLGEYKPIKAIEHPISARQKRAIDKIAEYLRNTFREFNVERELKILIVNYPEPVSYTSGKYTIISTASGIEVIIKDELSFIIHRDGMVTSYLANRPLKVERQIDVSLDNPTVVADIVDVATFTTQDLVSLLLDYHYGLLTVAENVNLFRSFSKTLTEYCLDETNTDLRYLPIVRLKTKLNIKNRKGSTLFSIYHCTGARSEVQLSDFGCISVYDENTIVQLSGLRLDQSPTIGNFFGDQSDYLPISDTESEILTNFLLSALDTTEHPRVLSKLGLAIRSSLAYPRKAIIDSLTAVYGELVNEDPIKGILTFTNGNSNLSITVSKHEITAKLDNLPEIIAGE